MARIFRATIREIMDIRQRAGSGEDYRGDYVAAIPLVDQLLPHGTEANEADLVWCDLQRAIGPSATQSLDLTNLTGGPGGGSINFVELRGIIVRNASGGALRFAPNGTNGWTALGASFSYDLPVGDYWRHWSFADGNLPVGASDKVLDITNTVASAGVFSVCIIGASA